MFVFIFVFVRIHDTNTDTQARIYIRVCTLPYVCVSLFLLLSVIEREIQIHANICMYKFEYICCAAHKLTLFFPSLSLSLWKQIAAKAKKELE